MLIARIVSDPEFRQSMVDNPEGAIQQANFQLDPEELRAISSSSREEREQMIQQLGERTAPAICTLWSALWIKVCIAWSTIRV